MGRAAKVMYMAVCLLNGEPYKKIEDPMEFSTQKFYTEDMKNLKYIWKKTMVTMNRFSLTKFIWMESMTMLCASILNGCSNRVTWFVLMPEFIIFPKHHGC